MEIERDWSDKLTYYYSNALHARLKTMINGHIFSRITDDRLTVEIVSRGIKTIYLRDNMTEDIVAGLTIEELAGKICKKHRKAVNKVIFNSGNRKGDERDVTEEFIEESEQNIMRFGQGE